MHSNPSAAASFQVSSTSLSLLTTIKSYIKEYELINVFFATIFPKPAPDSIAPPQKAYLEHLLSKIDSLHELYSFLRDLLQKCSDPAYFSQDENSAIILRSQAPLIRHEIERQINTITEFYRSTVTALYQLSISKETSKDSGVTLLDWDRNQFYTAELDGLNFSQWCSSFKKTNSIDSLNQYFLEGKITDPQLRQLIIDYAHQGGFCGFESSISGLGIGSGLQVQHSTEVRVHFQQVILINGTPALKIKRQVFYYPVLNSRIFQIPSYDSDAPLIAPYRFALSFDCEVKYDTRNAGYEFYNGEYALSVTSESGEKDYPKTETAHILKTMMAMLDFYLDHAAILHTITDIPIFSEDFTIDRTPLPYMPNVTPRLRRTHSHLNRKALPVLQRLKQWVAKKVKFKILLYNKKYSPEMMQHFLKTRSISGFLEALNVTHKINSCVRARLIHIKIDLAKMVQNNLMTDEVISTIDNELNLKSYYPDLSSLDTLCYPVLEFDCVLSDSDLVAKFQAFCIKPKHGRLQTMMGIRLDTIAAIYCVPVGEAADSLSLHDITIISGSLPTFPATLTTQMLHERILSKLKFAHIEVKIMEWDYTAPTFEAAPAPAPNVPTSSLMASHSPAVIVPARYQYEAQLGQMKNIILLDRIFCNNANWFYKTMASAESLRDDREFANCIQELVSAMKSLESLKFFLEEFLRLLTTNDSLEKPVGMTSRSTSTELSAETARKATLDMLRAKMIPFVKYIIMKIMHILRISEA
jgi:hypothetical protein